MKLSKRLGGDFSSQTRARGSDYYRAGWVRIQQGSDSAVTAKVQGARQYEVSIHCDDQELTMWCDCPYFDSAGPCKHLWATILAAEAQGFLSEAANADLDIIVYDYQDDDSDEEETDSAPPPVEHGLKPAPAPH